MNKNILVILVCIVIFSLYYCYNNSRELFTNKIRSTNVFGVHSNRLQNEPNNSNDSNSVIEIGNDEKENKIFKYKNKTYKINDDNLLENVEPKKINYKEIPLKLPVIIDNDKIKSLIPNTFMGHNFKGMIFNEYYKQYYTLYEKEYDNSNLNDKLYSYILAKKINNIMTVVHNIPPRNKILPGDNIYFSYGNFQLGPLKFV